ncbi:MAG TPA: hypothetical protein VFR10_03475 [bacterium]|nr:hypothetical protein [bacterium]
MVYAYGHLLVPPYEFSGVGTDTLLLNGYPYYRTDPSHYSLADSAGTESCHDRIVRAREAALTKAIRKNAPLADLKDYIDALNEQPFVEWAIRDTVDQTRVIVKMECTSSPFTISYPLASPSARPSAPKATQHEDAIRMFWKQVKFGVLIAFGEGYHSLFPLTTGATTELLRYAHELRAGGNPMIPKDADGIHKEVYRDILRAHTEAEED